MRLPSQGHCGPANAIDFAIVAADNPAMSGAVDDALSRGDLLEAFEIARAALTEDSANHGLQYRLTLCVARMGATALAQDYFDSFNLAQADDTDCQALGARLIKDRALNAVGQQRQALFGQAAKAYRAVYDRTGVYFVGVNAASLTLLSGQPDEARALASALMTDPDVAHPNCYYAAATAAECALILGAYDDARLSLQQAVAFQDANMGARASSLRQFHMLAEAESLDQRQAADVAAVLRPPPVLFYCGHRFSDKMDESAIAAQINRYLTESQIGIGYGALACGADILFAEAIVRRKGELNVVLPFAVEDFIAQSVADGGESWLARFHTCLASANSVTFASRSGFVGDPGQFRYGSRLAMGLTRVRASHMQADSIQIALWDGLGEANDAGTGRDVAEWRSVGGHSIVISADHIARIVATSPQPAPSINNRHQYSILFSDFAGFSKLPEHRLPIFWSEIMSCIAQILDAWSDVVKFRNAWGDALFAIIENPAAAASIALAIQTALRDLGLEDIGMPRGAGMRIALHHGPIYSMADPVVGKTSFIGTEITLTARIEPITPVGEVYVTQAFAAMLALENAAHYLCHYVGKMSLAKNFGTIPMYHLSRNVPPHT